MYDGGHLHGWASPKQRKKNKKFCHNNQLLPNYGNLYGICLKGFKIIIPFRDSNDFCHSISQSQKHASKWSSILATATRSKKNIAGAQARSLNALLPSLYNKSTTSRHVEMLWICCTTNPSPRQIHNKSKQWSLDSICCGLVVASQPIRELMLNG